MAKHGSHSVSFGVSFLKGAWRGGNENKNQFEKLKANRSQSKEMKFVPKCRPKEFAWGVCNDDMGHNYASTTTSGNF